MTAWRTRRVVLSISLAAVACGGPASGPVKHPAGVNPNATTPDAPFRKNPPLGTKERQFVPPAVREARLPNGLRLIAVEDRGAPLVVIGVAVARGAAAGKPSTAYLAMESLFGGTKVRDRSHLASGFQEIGARLSTHIGHDSFAVIYTVLPSGAQKTLSLLAEMFTQVDLSEGELARDKGRLVAKLHNARPDERLANAVASVLYAPGHPYRVDPWGDEPSMGTLSRDQVAVFMKDHVKPDQVIVAASGAVVWGDLLGEVQRAFGGWRGRAVPEPSLPDLAPSIGDAPVLVIDRPGSRQSEIRVAALCPPNDSADRLPLELLASVLGGIFTSRINLNLREKHGYSYSPHTSIDLRRGPGTFIANATVAAAQTGVSLREILHEFERVRTEPVSADELEMARSAFLRAIPAAFSTMETTAWALLELGTNHRPVDEYERLARDVRAVTVERLRSAALRYLAREKLRIVVMGDAAKVREQLDGFSVEVNPLEAF